MRSMDVISREEEVRRFCTLALNRFGHTRADPACQLFLKEYRDALDPQSRCRRRGSLIVNGASIQNLTHQDQQAEKKITIDENDM